MKAAVFDEPKSLSVRKRNLMPLSSGSVRLKVISCAVCGSDQRIFKEGNSRIKEPRVLGHEIAGEIVELGIDVKKFKIGDRLSIGADIPCGNCYFCNNGQPNCCDINLAMGYQFDGGFAEYVTLDKLVVEEGPVRKFDNKTPFDLACMAEPLACCINGFEVALAKSNQEIVIFGAGPIGIMLALLSKYYNCSNLIIIEPNTYRRNFAKKIFNDATVLNPKEVEVVDLILDKTMGRGADILFTACPVVETHKQAITCVAKKGVVNLFGGVPKNAPPIELLSNLIHYKEAYITGSHGSTPKQHAKALDLICNREIILDDLVSSRVKLDDINDVFTEEHIENNMKTIIKPNE